jgi:hypothetical protein
MKRALIDIIPIYSTLIFMSTKWGKVQYVEAYYNWIRRTLAQCIRDLTMFPLMGSIQETTLNTVHLMG